MTGQKQQRQYTYIHIHREKALYQKCCCVIPVQLVSYLCHKKPLPRSSRWDEHRSLHLPRPTPSHLENTTYRYFILPFFLFFSDVMSATVTKKISKRNSEKKDKTTARGDLSHHCLDSLRNSNSNNNNKKKKQEQHTSPTVVKERKEKEKRGVQLMVEENSWGLEEREKRRNRKYDLWRTTHFTFLWKPIAVMTAEVRKWSIARPCTASAEPVSQ